MNKILVVLFLPAWCAWIFLVPVTGCSSAASLPPVNHNGPLPTGTEADCSAMCVNLRKLNCPAGDPTHKGAPCEAVCLNTETSGYASENPRCQAKAPSCDAADACADEAAP
jgi:hypothetical protein